jgi:hypothetical protein
MELGGVGSGRAAFALEKGTPLATTPVKESWPTGLVSSRADAMLPVKAIAMLLDLTEAISFNR